MPEDEDRAAKYPYKGPTGADYYQWLQNHYEKLYKKRQEFVNYLRANIEKLLAILKSFQVKEDLDYEKPH